MAVSLNVYVPFDSGAGANVMEDTWRKMMRHMLGSASGVIRGFQNEFNPSAPGTGMTVTVDTGECWVRGHYGENSTLKTLSIATAHATLARVDRVVLRGNFATNVIELDVLTGTPSGTPVAPSLTQTSTTWETSIATVSVPANDTIISSGQVTDDRMYTSAQARYTKLSNQAAATTTYTKISWSSTPLSKSGDIVFDSSTNNFTLLRSGLWIITAAYRIEGGGGSKRQILIVDPANVSGGSSTDCYGAQSTAPSAVIESHVSCSAIMRFPVNQVIAVFCYQDHGSNRNILGDSINGTFVSLVWVGP